MDHDDPRAVTPRLALLLFALAACSSSSKPPPIVASGGAPGAAGGGPTHDAGDDADSSAVSTVTHDDATTATGPTQTLTCTYIGAGTEGVFCAIEVGVPVADVASYEASCTSATFDGTPAATCSPDSLTGCCRYASGVTPSFGDPTWVCYYPGDSDDATTCQTSGGVWSLSLP